MVRFHEVAQSQAEQKVSEQVDAEESCIIYGLWAVKSTSYRFLFFHRLKSLMTGFSFLININLTVLFSGAKTRWKSVKHKAKYQKMLDPNTNTTKIGPVRVSFTLEFLIGRGCQGTCVYYGLHDDGSEVALKRILAHIYEGSEKEIAKLVDLKTSDHIVNYRGIVSDTTFLYVILDLCEETLADYVKAHDREFLERRGPVIIREILTGLQALHTGDKIVLHRDLKPQNILVDLEGRMRLADFGVSRILEQDESTQSTDPHGTLGWVAVESIKVNEDGRVKFNRKSDIQVVGMVCFYVLTKGEHPFGSKDERHSNIKNGSPVNLEKLSDPIAKRFISWLISHQIEDRPYADQALADPYLQLRSGNEKDLQNIFICKGWPGRDLLLTCRLFTIEMIHRVLKN